MQSQHAWLLRRLLRQVSPEVIATRTGLHTVRTALRQRPSLPSTSACGTSITGGSTTTTSASIRISTMGLDPIFSSKSLLVKFKSPPTVRLVSFGPPDGVPSLPESALRTTFSMMQKRAFAGDLGSAMKGTLATSHSIQSKTFQTTELYKSSERQRPPFKSPIATLGHLGLQDRRSPCLRLNSAT